MMYKGQLEVMCNGYLAQYPAEQQRVSLFREFLERTTDEGLYHRKNFGGHITTSAFIVDRDRLELLLLKHKSLERWLQPGGHTEEDATLVASAKREAVEETGIKSDELRYVQTGKDAEVPFDIDSHYIPANPKKDEAGHYHHDIRYVFAYSGARSNQFNEQEATGMKWIAFDALVDDEVFGVVISKMSIMLK